jgi:hypothetical protein
LDNICCAANCCTLVSKAVLPAPEDEAEPKDRLPFEDVDGAGTGVGSSTKYLPCDRCFTACKASNVRRDSEVVVAILRVLIGQSLLFSLRQGPTN